MSDEPSTVLLCYDGSPQAEHAAEVAGRLFPGAHAHVLYVWEPVERIIARYSVLAPFMGEEVGAADADVEAEAAPVADGRRRARAARPASTRSPHTRRAREHGLGGRARRRRAARRRRDRDRHALAARPARGRSPTRSPTT